MKLTASFAILAVLASKTFVAAAPIDVAYDSALEARAEFVDDALEDVWSRFYDELLEEVDAREYEEEIFERAPMKKFAQDLGIGLAQKAPKMAQQYSQSQQSSNRQQLPRPAFVTNNVAKPVLKPSGKKRSLEYEEDVFERAPMMKFAQDLGIGLAQKAPKMAQQYTQSQNAKIRNQLPRPPFVTNNVAKPLLRPAGKKRSLDYEEDIFERAPMLKFAQDVGIGLAQKAPKMAQQYTQSQQAKVRQQLPRPAFVTNNVAKPILRPAGKKRSLEYEEDVFERAPMMKFAQDLGIGLAQKAPKMAQQYTQSQNAKIRNQLPRPAFVTNNVAKPILKPAGKKRSLEYEEDIFERAPMMKFAKDLATNLAQKAPKMAQQYTQSQQSNNRRPFVQPAQPQQQKPAASRPSIPKPPPLPAVKKPSVLAEVKKAQGKK